MRDPTAFEAIHALASVRVARENVAKGFGATNARGVRVAVNAVGRNSEAGFPFFSEPRGHSLRRALTQAVPPTSPPGFTRTLGTLLVTRPAPSLLAVFLG